MAVAWPTVKDRLVEVITALVPDDVLVFDGPLPTGEAPTAYVCVGWQPSTDDTSAGSYDQELGPDGFQLRETGTVLLEFGAITGDTEVPSAFDSAAALQASVKADPRLDAALSQDGTSSVSTDVVEAQNRAGAVQRLLVTFTYTTRV